MSKYNHAPKEINLTAIELGGIDFLIAQELHRLKGKRIWFSTVGEKCAIEYSIEKWEKIRAKLYSPEPDRP